MILLNIKTTDKLENQMSTLAKLKSGNVKRESLDRIIDLQKLKEFNVLKIEVKKTGQQSKNLDSENRRLEQLVKI